MYIYVTVVHYIHAGTCTSLKHMHMHKENAYINTCKLDTHYI